MAVYFVTGGAGFIGSHLVRALLDEEKASRVVIYDNFSSGKMHHLEDAADNPVLTVVKADLKDKDAVTRAMRGADVVYHFASNPDISKAVTQPDIDFWDGTYLTNNVLEAMRTVKAKRLIYASGSGVYGDTDSVETDEDYSPMLPISTYGASKLAGESLICAYCHMFGISAVSLRFANVVGRYQTHGVCYDFVRRLLENPHELTILGDGKQSKSYIGISDAVAALRIAVKKAPDGFSRYNVATSDNVTVTEIADIVVEVMGLKGVKYHYTDGRRGWKGDVPVVRLDSAKIGKLGWKNAHTSREALCESAKAIYEDKRFKRGEA